MTVEQLLQLYAPLAGLLAITFWLGVLSARVTTLEREERDRKVIEREAPEERDRVTRLETKFEAIDDHFEQMQRSISEIQRSLSNLVTGRGNRPIRIEERG